MTESAGIIEEILTPANVVNYFSVGVGILSVLGSFYIASKLMPTDKIEVKKVVIALIPAAIGVGITLKMITSKE